jgi:AraC-like DNA-binding protein/quercetin dioxygenase-like cupin family protein
MTVSASSARLLPKTDNEVPQSDVSARIGRVELRRGGRARAGSYLYEGHRLVTGWHSHDLHQIQYAIGGVVEVETASAHYLLPPQQAAWIPVGLEHQATMTPDVRSVAVMFDPELLPALDVHDNRARIVMVSPLIRQMMIYALRWPIGRPDSDLVSDGFFQTLGHLVFEALDHEAPLSLPTAENPTVAAAMDYTKAHLSSATAAEVSRAVAVSERTLRRQFDTAVGMSWRTYLLHARILRAMALLVSPDDSVQKTASAVGFDSLSAFTRAFTRFSGETPSSYRQRARQSETA